MHCWYDEYSFILQNKFELMMSDLRSNTFDHFSNMQDHLEKYRNFVSQTERYVTEILFC
jgi:hypothetical protein